MVTRAAIPPSPGGPIRPPPTQPQTTNQRSAPTPTSHNPPTPAAPTTAPVAPLNFSAPPSKPSAVVGGQAAVQQQQQQQQVAAAVTTPTTPSLPPYKQEDLHKWLYKDPQGEIQGRRVVRGSEGERGGGGGQKRNSVL